MQSSFTRTAASTIALLAVSAPAAMADVTPQQVWDDLSAYMQNFGYSVTATQTETGDDLVVSDVTIAMDMPEEEGSFGIQMDEIVLTDRGDGSVLVAFPPEMPMVFDMTGSEGEEVRTALSYEQSGLEMIVSGDPDDMVYDYTADTLRIALGELVVDGETVSRDMARGSLSLSDLVGQSTSSASGDGREIAQTMTAAGATYDFGFTDPDSGGTGSFTGSMANLRFEGSSSVPAEFDASDMEAMMAAGLSGDGSISYENGQTDFTVTEEGQTTTGKMSSDSARLTVSLSPEALSYEIGNTGLDVNITAPDVPFPITGQMERSSFNIAMPVAASEDPQDFAMGLTLGGFTTSESLWGMIDPNGDLPRDPATISIALSGEATPFVNILDSQAMENLETSGEPPAELNALTLESLEVAAVGARLTGEGDFTFDNSDMETFDGFPKPEGSVDLSLTGANALIDKLIGMGLLAEEDAMGARMMMSMFTVPAGDDALESTIEVNDQGHVLANGQRIR